MDTKAAPTRSTELFQRIVSGLALIAISLAMTVYSADAFALLIVIFAVLMGWEWANVARGRGADVLFYLQTAVVVAAAGLAWQRYPALAGAWVIASSLFAFHLHKVLRPGTDPWWSAAGVYYAGFPAVALIALRQDPGMGLAAIVYLFAIVWCTDTGAFFTGRLAGGPKLAPTVSPNKTWSGLIGGAMAALIAGAIFAVWLGGTSVFALGLQSLVLALLAQGGDLGESALKRFFGVKHSGTLIPGHGGVLDRLDSLVFVAVGAGLIAAVRDPARPAHALLLW
jgi:phosphatidate cytidylyltransferase